MYLWRPDPYGSYDSALRAADRAKKRALYDKAEYGSEIMRFYCGSSKCYFSVDPHVGWADSNHESDKLVPYSNKVSIAKNLKADLDGGKMATINGYWHSHPYGKTGFSEDDFTTLDGIAGNDNCMFVTILELNGMMIPWPKSCEKN